LKATSGEEEVMNKSRAIWLFLIALSASAEACVNHGSDKPAPTLAASPTRISVAETNAYIRTGRAETKMAGDLLNKWDADTNAATSLENLKQIEIDESPILDQAVQHHNKSAELMNIVQSAHPTSCVESASIMTKMAIEDLAVEIEKRDLLIQSDISTAAGVAQFRRAFAPLSAREHAIVDKKNAYMESAAYKNACGPND